jgi:hypothetical protein
MFTVPAEMVAVVAPLAPIFSQARVWRSAQILLWGTILAHGRRTVAAALRACGLEQRTDFCSAHRVLSHRRWAGMLSSARRLLAMLLAAFLSPDATVVVAVDDCIERRHSMTLFGLGAYRDPVQSSAKHQVTCFGLRWLVASLCVRMPGAERVWALPFLCSLVRPPQVKSRRAACTRARRTATAKRSKAKHATQAPERRARACRRGLRSRRRSTAERPLVRTPAQRQQQAPPEPRRHKSVIDVAAQMLSALERWLPGRRVVVVLDGAFYSYKLLRHAASCGIGVVTRGRWETVLYQAPEPKPSGRKGPQPSRGARLGTVRELALSETTEYQQVEIAWYGGERKRFSVARGTGLWANDRQKAIAVGWVVTRDLEPDASKRLRDEVFVTTCVQERVEQVLEWYVWRWSQEVTFEEARAHLGLQTQRQWSRQAVRRATPALLGLFSLVVLVAHGLGAGAIAKRETAWYRKSGVTFSDCLAVVRRRLWRARNLQALEVRMQDGQISAEQIQEILDLLPLSA